MMKKIFVPLMLALGLGGAMTACRAHARVGSAHAGAGIGR